MSVKIRCVEGHVFERNLGQCQKCGWKVPQENEGIRNRLRDSIRLFAINAIPEFNNELSPPGAAASIISKSILVRVLRARTIFMVSLVVVLLTYLVNLSYIPLSIRKAGWFDYTTGLDYYGYVIGGSVIAITLFGLKRILRSDIPNVLLVFCVLFESYLLQGPFWPKWAHIWNYLIPTKCWRGDANVNCISPFPTDIPIIGPFLGYVLGVGLSEDLLKTIPLAVCLLIVSLMRTIPMQNNAALFRKKILDWSRIERPTSLLMIAFASGCAFVLFETLAGNSNYVQNTVFTNARWFQQLFVTIPIKEGAKQFPLGDYLSWTTGGAFGIGLALTRTLDTLLGHGAYAAIIAYYIALSRYKTWSTAVLLVCFGVLLSAIMHGTWDIANLIFKDIIVGYFTLSLLLVGILFGICFKTIELDQKAGFIRGLLPLGDSFLFDEQIPTFPMGQRPQSGPLIQPQNTKPPLHTQLDVSPAVHAVANLLIEGKLGVPGRRVPLLLGSGKVELEPGIAFELVPHPSDPKRFGLTNLGTRHWTYESEDGRVVDIQPGQNSAVILGAAIDFGPARGRFEKVTGRLPDQI